MPNHVRPLTISHDLSSYGKVLGLVRLIDSGTNDYYVLSDDVAEPDGAELYFLIYVQFNDDNHYITRDCKHFWRVLEDYNPAVREEISAFGIVFGVDRPHLGNRANINEIEVAMCKNLLGNFDVNACQ